jgi:hypothetical protein
LEEFGESGRARDVLGSEGGDVGLLRDVEGNGRGFLRTVLLDELVEALFAAADGCYGDA